MKVLTLGPYPWDGGRFTSEHLAEFASAWGSIRRCKALQHARALDAQGKEAECMESVRQAEQIVAKGETHKERQSKDAWLPCPKHGTKMINYRLFDDPNWRTAMGILWTIIIGFVAGLIAKFLHPGPNEPSGFIVTTLLGIAGAFLATFLGQAIGWYQAGEGAGLIGAIVGAIIVLVVWGMFASRNAQRV